jgi:two-component system sensor histidine kinase MtrB
MVTADEAQAPVSDADGYDPTHAAPGPAASDTHRQPKRKRLRLRTRLTLAFGLGALLLSTLLSGVTYALTRNNLLDRREADAVELAQRNAGRLSLVITDETTEDGVRTLLASQATIADAVPVLRFEGEVGLIWISADPVAFSAPAQLNPALLNRLAIGDPEPHSAQMRYRIDNRPFLVIGIPLENDSIYVEAVPLDDIEDTLGSLGLALLGAAVVTTLAGVGLGSWASRRVLLPLEEVSETAEALAGGDLSARLDVEQDRDLTALAVSFNHMAANLEERIERDAQFASDVSHELRSPLTTIMASVGILESRRDGLSEIGRTALDLLSSDLERFNQLVADLLEISRYDTAGGQIDQDYFPIVEFVRRATAETGHSHVPVIFPDALDGTIVIADKRRLARVIANLLQNADNYGGGPTAIELRRVGKVMEIAVEDSGAGVPVEERQLIFGRFARGSEGGSRGDGTGTGLGLALVAEHVRLHSGRVRVDDRPDGESGARFVVELPIVAE